MPRLPATGAFLLIALAAYFGPRLAADSAVATPTSGLRVDSPHWDLGHILEGASVEHTFQGTNPTDHPVRITGAQHCSCLQVQVPAEPIPPGAGFTVTARLDSTRRSGRLVKPIDLETDEPGATKVRLSAVGFVDSPILFRRGQIQVSGARPGQVDEHRLKGTLDPRATGPRLVGTRGDFLEAPRLEETASGEVLLTLTTRAPDRPVTGEVTLECDFQGRPWTLQIPVRVSVRAALTAFPAVVRLRPDRSRTVTIQNHRPDECRATEVTVSHPDLVTVEELERTDVMLKIRVGRVGAGTPADGPIRLIVGASDPSEPALEIAVDFVDG